MPRQTSTNESVSDAKGKLHEVATLYAFSGNVWSNTLHYRAEGQSPLDIFNVCANTLGHDATVRIMDDSYGTFLNIVERLHADDVLAATNAYWDATWTSNEDSVGALGDHERFTGVKDLNSDADIMIRTEEGPLGISLKYGNSRNPNLKNPGKPLIEEMLRLEDLDRHRKPHDELLAALGFTGSAQANHQAFKAERYSERSLAAVRSSLAYRKAIAAEIRNALTQRTEAEVKEFVLGLCANPTVFKHYRSLTHTKGEDTRYHVADVVEHATKMADQYVDWHIARQNNMTVTIKGTHREHGTEEVLAMLQIKNQSGPMKSWNGTITAPMLVERKRPMKVMHTFDMDDTMFWYQHDDCAMVHLVSESGEFIRKLTPHEYSTYKRKPGERYNYSEFRDSGLLVRTARPIWKILDKMAKLVDDGELVNILTARHEFDDWDRVSSFIQAHGVDMTKVRIHSAGKLTHPGDSTALAKKRKFVELCQLHRPDVVKFWDDSLDNIDNFWCLGYDHPELGLKRLEARHVTHNPKKGTTRVGVAKWQSS